MRSFEVYGVDRDRQRLVERLKKQNQPYPGSEHHMPDHEKSTAVGTLVQPVFFVTSQTLTAGRERRRPPGAVARWIYRPAGPPSSPKAMVNARLGRAWSARVSR